MESQLFQILKSTPALTALLGTNPFRVYEWDEAPQGVTYPYVTYSYDDVLPENFMDKAPDMDNIGTEINVWAKSGRSCRHVAEEIRKALEKTCHMTSAGNAGRDNDTKAFRFRMNFDIFTSR